MLSFNCEECGKEIQIADLGPEMVDCGECKETVEVPLRYRKEIYGGGIASFIVGIILAFVCLGSGSTDSGISWLAIIAACVCFFGGIISLLVSSGSARTSNTIKRLGK